MSSAPLAIDILRMFLEDLMGMILDVFFYVVSLKFRRFNCWLKPVFCGYIMMSTSSSPWKGIDNYEMCHVMLLYFKPYKIRIHKWIQENGFFSSFGIYLFRIVAIMTLLQQLESILLRLPQTKFADSTDIRSFSCRFLFFSWFSFVLCLITGRTDINFSLCDPHTRVFCARWCT